MLKRLGIPMSTAIDMYLNQISLTGGIPFEVTLPKSPSVLNADLMTAEEIHKKLQEGYDDIQAGRMLVLPLRNLGRAIKHEAI